MAASAAAELLARAIEGRSPPRRVTFPFSLDQAGKVPSIVSIVQASAGGRGNACPLAISGTTQKLCTVLVAAIEQDVSELSHWATDEAAVEQAELPSRAVGPILAERYDQAEFEVGAPRTSRGDDV